MILLIYKYFLFLTHQDIAVHTRVTPMQREECTRKFLQNVASNPEVCVNSASNLH